MKTNMTSTMLVAALCIGGCATTESGHPFDRAKADQLVRGKSTKADAAALLGQPNGSQSLPNGSSQLVFTHTVVNATVNPFAPANYTWEECRVGFDVRGLYSGTECNVTGAGPGH